MSSKLINAARLYAAMFVRIHKVELCSAAGEAFDAGVFVYGLERGIVSDLAVTQSQPLRASDTLLRRMRANDLGVEEEVLDLFLGQCRSIVIGVHCGKRGETQERQY